MGKIAILLGSLTVFGLLIFQGDAVLPTNYEYYASTIVKEGLNTNHSYFTLNGKFIQIFSGAVHYFRVPRAYWRDRLRKVRAAGLNAVETYVAWNLHEPESGKYDFGYGGSDFEDFLHLEEFLKVAKEEDLFVIIRSGPYICAEYNFGGFPAWLLREKTIGFRTSEATYMKYVSRYFNVLLSLLKPYQFTYGGPIIAFQVENEYGNQEDGKLFQPDKKYLQELHQLFVNNGIKELLVTADSPLSHQDKGTLPGIFLQTANLGDAADKQLAKLEELQPGKPQMVMEFWSGWFTHWGQNFTGKTLDKFERILGQILNHNASLNFYMFHGGTNFGFNNGASASIDDSSYKSIITSYDYGAPLNEAGGYTDKYVALKKLIAAKNTVKTRIPEQPAVIPPVAYPKAKIIRALPLQHIIKYNAPHTLESENVIAMEKLNLNNGNGQANGYVVYRKENVDLEANAVLTIKGHVCDTVVVEVNGVLVAPTKLDSASDFNKFGFSYLKDPSVTLTKTHLKGATIDIMVENMGRANGGKIFVYNHTLKGLWQGDVMLNNQKLSGFKIVPLELKKYWVNHLQQWQNYTKGLKGPTMYNALLKITDEPKDTYVDMRGWGKGMVFVNGFNIGRYVAVGPQQSLYIPAPFLFKGENYINMFEHFYSPSSGEVSFVDKLLLENVKP